jgi:hypothetical protein
MGIRRGPRRYLDRTFLRLIAFSERGLTRIDPLELLATKALRIMKMLRIGRIPIFTGSIHPFTDYFRGYEVVEAVRRLFGEGTEDVLRNLKVELTTLGGYMWVSGVDGHLVVSSSYLNNGDRVDIHLDVVHELVHVKQFMEGKELFDTHYGYTDRPTEIEAYRYAVEEARRMGLSNERICQYLKTEWISDHELKRLAKALNVECTQDEQEN